MVNLALVHRRKMAEVKLFSVKIYYKQPAERQDKGSYEMFLKGQSTG